MAVVGIRQLSRDTSRIIKEFEETGEPVIVTREGRPIGTLMPVEREQLEDLALVSAPELRRGFEQARKDFEEGRSTSIEDLAREEGIEPELELEDVAEESPGVVELGSLSESLKPDLVAVINRRLTDEVQAISREALVSIVEIKKQQLPPMEVRELNEQTAAVYGQLFRRNFVRRLAVQRPAMALRFSQSETTAAMRRSLGKSISNLGDISVDRHLATLRGMMAAWESEEPAAGQPTDALDLVPEAEAEV